MKQMLLRNFTASEKVDSCVEVEEIISISLGFLPQCALKGEICVYCLPTPKWYITGFRKDSKMKDLANSLLHAYRRFDI